MKIAIYPQVNDFPNKYLERMVKTIKLAYPDAIISSFPPTKKLFSLKGYDYVWLNWFENLYNQHKTRLLFSKIISLLVLKAIGIKIVSTFHNRKPHESADSILDGLIFWMTFRFSSKIIILSNESRLILEQIYGKSILKKTILIPHPTYDCIPKTPNKSSDQFSILFFGHLRPYKNIELIFDIAKANPNISFTIAGSPLNIEYEKELSDKAKHIRNIHLISRFLSSEEIDWLIESHSILLLPYDLKSSLNSGVVVHAICKGINMIVPAIGTVNQFINKDCIYSYCYSSEEEHLEKLNYMIGLAKKEYETDIKVFESRINKLYDEVISTQNPEALSSYIKSVFKE